MRKIILLYFCLSIWPLLSAKVLIITHSYNRPDFIELQYKTFKKFLQDDYEFVVFNDARDEFTRKKIKNVCENLNVSCIVIPQEIHIGRDNPCERCADVVKYSLKILGFQYDGKVMIIDSDMFLINDFNVEKTLGNYVVAGVRQRRSHVDYIWNGLVLINMQQLPDKDTFDFDCGRVEGVAIDVGGQLYHYFKNHAQIKLLYIDCKHMDYLVCSHCAKMQKVGCTHNTKYLKSLKFNDRCIQLIESGVHNIEFLCNNSFIHYRGGGNWDGKSSEYHKQKTVILNHFMNDLLS